MPQLEVNYNLNSAGTLTLANGGQFKLHQNVCFTAVTIDGTALPAGTYFYNELYEQFPANFTTGGSGSITVQPYGTPPTIVTLVPTLVGKVLKITFTGVPNASYVIQSSSDLKTWNPVGAAITADSNGKVEYRRHRERHRRTCTTGPCPSNPFALIHSRPLAARRAALLYTGQPRQLNA